MGDAQVVIGALGWLIIIAGLLGVSGLTSQTIELPSSPSADDDEAVNQSFTKATVECIFTLFSDCSRQTESKLFGTISDLVAFSLSAVTFLFQLLTFQIPEIPGWLSFLIVGPPAAALAYVGLKFVRGLSG